MELNQIANTILWIIFYQINFCGITPTAQILYQDTFQINSISTDNKIQNCWQKQASSLPSKQKDSRDIANKSNSHYSYIKWHQQDCGVQFWAIFCCNEKEDIINHSGSKMSSQIRTEKSKYMQFFREMVNSCKARFRDDDCQMIEEGLKLY